ncbi:hypothetical protein SUDANB130_06614 [Streptomyces sp. enrichment culture]
MTQTVVPHQVPKLLDDVFGIRTDPEEARLLVTRLRELDCARHRRHAARAFTRMHACGYRKQLCAPRFPLPMRANHTIMDTYGVK